jgi:hypothetical protein
MKATEDARGTQPGMVLQGLLEELHVGVDRQGTENFAAIELVGL